MAHVSATIISNVDPFSDSFSLEEEQTPNSFPRARWRSLWGNFGIAYFHAETPELSEPKAVKTVYPSDETHLYSLVNNECRWTPVLSSFGKTHIAFAKDKRTKLETPHTEATVSRAILQLAKSYYEEIWQSLTIDEHLALFHLAKDRFIHFEHPGLEPLIRKGLLRFGPDLCLLNASFREFVLIVGERDSLRETEAIQDHSLWGKLKWPMGLGFGTILLVLIVTQEELRAALPAVIALAPVLFRGLPELSGKIKV